MYVAQHRAIFPCHVGLAVMASLWNLITLSRAPGTSGAGWMYWAVLLIWLGSARNAPSAASIAGLYRHCGGEAFCVGYEATGNTLIADVAAQTPHHGIRIQQAASVCTCARTGRSRGHGSLSFIRARYRSTATGRVCLVSVGVMTSTPTGFDCLDRR